MTNKHFNSFARAFAPFRHKDFVFLWVSGITSGVTMSMKMLISTQWLYNETSSSVLVGMLGLAQLFQMPVVLFGGVMADSSDRKKLMIYTQFVSFVMLFALAIF